VRQEHDRGDAGRRSEDDVFERAKAHDAHARFALRDAGPAQGDDVGREPTVGDEDAEAGEDDCRQLHYAELRPALDARDLPVREHVAEVGHNLAEEREANPEGPGMPEPVQDVAEARGPGDTDGRSDSENDPEGDEEDDLPRRVVEVAPWPKPGQRRLELEAGV
jgi:hypothetical protein